MNPQAAPNEPVPFDERCPPRQTSRVERFKPRVEPLSSQVTVETPKPDTPTKGVHEPETRNPKPETRNPLSLQSFLREGRVVRLCWAN